MTTADQERVVLLDEDLRPIGTAPKSEVHRRDTPLHLAFSCYLFDLDGRFLLTQRAGDKRTWPGVWSNSCCGHPAPGERVEEAVVRRVRQELGTHPTDLRLLLPNFRYRAVMDDGTVENELCPVYVATCRHPGGLVLDPTETASARWIDWKDFRADVLDGRLEVSPWCSMQVAALPENPHDP